MALKEEKKINKQLNERPTQMVVIQQENPSQEEPKKAKKKPKVKEKKSVPDMDDKEVTKEDAKNSRKTSLASKEVEAKSKKETREEKKQKEAKEKEGEKQASSNISLKEAKAELETVRKESEEREAMIKELKLKLLAETERSQQEIMKTTEEIQYYQFQTDGMYLSE